MPEKQPIPLDPRAAQRILGARTELTDDPRLGEGIKFTLPVGSTLEIFSRENVVTAARVHSPQHSGGYIEGTPLNFTHGDDWVGVRGTTEEGITLFAALRNTGATVIRSSDPSPEGADSEEIRASRLAFVNRKLEEMEERRPEREARERARKGSLDRIAHPPSNASAADKQLALLVRQQQRLGALAEALAEREGIDISDAYTIVQQHIIDGLSELAGVTPDPTDDTPISELATQLANRLSPESARPAAQVFPLHPTDPLQEDAASGQSESSAPLSGAEVGGPPTGKREFEQGERFSFTGPIGRNPQVTPIEGRPPRVFLVVGQPAPTDEDPDHKQWYDVYAAPKSAETIASLVRKGTLTTGTTVQVKGYKHTYGPEYSDKDGKPYVRAFLVRPTGTQRRPGAK